MNGVLMGLMGALETPLYFALLLGSIWQVQRAVRHGWHRFDG